MTPTFLNDVLIVELGARGAASSCGALLAELGARVIFVEPTVTAGQHKWAQRAEAAAGKESLSYDPESAQDTALLASLVAASDAVLTSSDIAAAWEKSAVTGLGVKTIHCDITAFGNSGPLSGLPYPDALLQAESGAMTVSGNPEGAPALSACPYLDGAAAAFATASILVALGLAKQGGRGQHIDISIFDCAISMNATFLSQYFFGMEPGRIGNRHVSMSPWNAYHTSDGWVLLCTGSNEQWKRVCSAIGQPELAVNPDFDVPKKRIANHVEVDAFVEAWTSERSTNDCIQKFNGLQLPCGPVYGLQEMFNDPSLVAREMVQQALDTETGKLLKIAGSAFRGTHCKGRARHVIPVRDSGRAWVTAFLEGSRSDARAASKSAIAAAGPLAGLKVLEIGSYTTAPSCARQLGALGADVVKLEPPLGDPARALPPQRYEQGIFFTIGNSDKRAIMLDLKKEAEMAIFHELLKEADVFVENLRPGALSQLGLAPADILALNPRIVYCSISGFGVDSPFADRGAMDTTVQAMSGLMDLTRDPQSGVPLKIGMSVSDAAGGQYGLIAILAALSYRERSGVGQWIDLSMQDISASLAQSRWNEQREAAALIACKDGWVVCDATQQQASELLLRMTRGDEAGTAAGDRKGERATYCTRDQIAQYIRSAGLRCAFVNKVSEAMQGPQSIARGHVIVVADGPEKQWNLLASPMRLELTPPTVKKAIGPIGCDTQQVLAAWLPARRQGRLPQAL